MRVGYGISGTNILSIGRGVSVGGGGVPLPEVEFLLRDDFLTDEAAPLANPRTAEPGPGTGTFEVQGNEYIAGGYLKLSGGSRLRYGGVSRVPGRAFVRLAQIVGGDINWGFDDNTSTAFGDAVLRTVDGGFYHGSTALGTLGEIPSGEFVSAIVLRSDGAFLVADNKLLFPLIGFSAATVYPGHFISVGAGTSVVGTYRVADLLGPWSTDYGIATDRIAGSVSAGATFAHEANCLVEWTQTTVPSVDYTDMYLRRVDASNGIVVSTVSDGSIELFELSGGNWSSLGSVSAATVANGHRLVVVCSGTTIRVYSNNTLRITGTSSVGQAATAGRLDALGTGGAVSNIVAWPRTLSGIAKQWLDAAIAN